MKLFRYIYLFREFILLSLLFITLEKLVNGRQLYSFLNPEYHIFVNLALMTVFFLTAAAFFKSAGRDAAAVNIRGSSKYIIFLLIIALLNIEPDTAAFNTHISDASGSASGGSFTGYSSSGNLKPGPDGDIFNSSGDFIEIRKENYYFIVNHIYAAPEKFDGKRISIDGFVHRSKKSGKGEFVIARLIMFCCAADAGIGGFIADASGISESFRKDEWLRVAGTLRTEKRGGEEPVPVLTIDSFQRIPADKEPYIYPSY